jgi:hypothetical protein
MYFIELAAINFLNKFARLHFITCPTNSSAKSLEFDGHVRLRMDTSDLGRICLTCCISVM